jgi:sarcosine oxidase subunit gamma
MVDDALTVTEAHPRSAAGIAAFRDHAGLRAALQAELGADIPTTPRFIQAGGITLSCLSPTRYLATGPRDSNLPARFSQRLQDLAAITDQSDLWQVFTCSGPLVRESLARLVPIDLRPETFPVGGLALTRAGHLDTRLWRLADTTYEVAVARSYAEDVRYLLQMEASARS